MLKLIRDVTFPNDLYSKCRDELSNYDLQCWEF